MTRKDDRTKLLCCTVGTFLLGVTTAYRIARGNPLFELNWDLAVDLLMAGAAPLGSYLLGYWQRNPRNDDDTVQELVTAVRVSNLPLETKVQVVPVLTAVKPPA